ncbi:ABC transporter permease, partial [Micromonospora sp. NPDC048999]
MTEGTGTAAPKRPADVPAQSPSADSAGAGKAGASARFSFWRGDGGEGVRRNLGLVATLLVLVVIGIVTRPDLYGDASWVWGNTLTILKLASVVGVVTVGMTFVIIGGGIDLSVGAIVAVAGVWSTTVATQSFGAAGMIFTALTVGLGVGVVNGLLVSYGRLVPFIATL